MKVFAVIATLAVAVAANEGSTVVVCPDCHKPSSTNDMVTREPIPTSSCDTPPLTVVKTGSMSGGAMPTGGMNPGGMQSGGMQSGGMNPSQTGGEGNNPTSPPITGGAGRLAGGAAAAIAVAAAML